MKISELTKILTRFIIIGAVSVTALMGGCASNSPYKSITYNYTTDHPGLRDISQIMEHDGHTIVGMALGSFPGFTDDAGNPINYDRFGQSYRFDRIYKRFSIDTGKTVINVIRHPIAGDSHSSSEE